MKVTAIQAPKIIKALLRQKITPMLHGSPGIGKSDIIKQIGDETKLKIVDIRLSQCDITDLNGFPSISEDGTKSRYVPMNTFPVESDPIPEGFKGWLIFLDELNSASLSVQAAALTC